VDEFVELPTAKRTMIGNALGFARLLARRYQRLYWTHPAHIEAFKRLRYLRVDAVIANDLDTLPLALRTGSPVVFDAHEYAPGQFLELARWRLVIAPYVRWQCRRYIPRAASMTTVGEAIADAYNADTGVRPVVVTNAPPRADLTPTRVHEPIRILHHGTAQRGRGLKEMIQLGEMLDTRFTIDFVLVEGSRGYREELIRRTRGNPNIAFPRPWPMGDLVRRANDYDIGLFLLPPVSFQRRFALPNKFFEFIQARLAVAVGPSPEMASIVNRYGCGIVAADFSAETLGSAINALDVSSIAAFKQAAHVAASELSAEANSDVLLRAVDDALSVRTTSHT
jgi:hypothetical protein